MYPVVERALDFILVILGLFVVACASPLLAYLRRCRGPIDKKMERYGSTKEDFQSFGFLKNQIVPYQVRRPNGEIIHTWIVLPTRMFLQYEKTLLSDWTTPELREVVKDLFVKDELKNFVIYFPESPGSFGATEQSEIYRSISSGDPEHIYAITFEYLGQQETGLVDESQVRNDAVTLINWVHTKFEIQYGRIALLGHGFGASVVLSAADTILETDPYVEFAGLMLCSPRPNAQLSTTLRNTSAFPNILSTMFSALSNLFHSLHSLSNRQINHAQKQAVSSSHADSIDNLTERIKTIVCKSDALRLTLIESQKHADQSYLSFNTALITSARAQLTALGLFEEYEDKTHQQSSGITEYRFGSKSIRQIAISYRAKHAGCTFSVSSALMRCHDYMSSWSRQALFSRDGDQDKDIMQTAQVAFEVAKIFQNAGVARS